MRKVLGILMIGLVLALSGCSNVNKNFMLEFPNFDVDDYMIDKGEEDSYEDLTSLYAEINDETIARYGDARGITGVISFTDLEEDTYMVENNMEHQSFENYFKVFPSDLTYKYNYIKNLEGRSRHTDFTSNERSIFIDMVLHNDTMVEDDDYTFSFDNSDVEGKFIMNDGSLYMRYLKEATDGDFINVGEYLKTDDKGTEIESVEILSSQEAGTYYYRSVFIEDEYSYAMTYTISEADVYYYYYYTDFENNESHYLRVVLNLEYPEESYVYLQKYIGDENSLLSYVQGENEFIKTYSYLDEGVAQVHYIEEESNGSISRSVKHNLTNVTGYDFLGGVTYSSDNDYMYFVKDNELIELSEYEVVKEDNISFTIQKSVGSLDIATEELYESDVFGFTNEYDFDIKEAVNLFDNITIEVDGLEVSISGEKLNVAEEDFIYTLIDSDFEDILKDFNKG